MGAMSVITMFFPRNSAIIATLLFGVFIFGIYIPWEERKKKKKKSRPGSGTGAASRRTSGRPAGRPGTGPAGRSGPARTSPRPEEASQVSQLDSLLDAGLLTREEYDQRKQRLLKK